MADSVSVYDALEVGCMTVQDVVGLRRERDALQARYDALLEAAREARVVIQKLIPRAYPGTMVEWLEGEARLNGEAGPGLILYNRAEMVSTYLATLTEET